MQVTRNNLDCVSALILTLYRTFKNIVMDLMVKKKKDLARKLYQKLYHRNISRKNISEKNGGKRSCLKRIRSYETGEEGGGSRHSFAR